MRILLTGATGFVGRNLAPALVGEGHEVVAATRQPDRYEGPGTAVAVDVLDPDSVAKAVDGCDAAYFLVHSMEGADFEAKDRRAAEGFAAAASAAGTRVVYLGGLGAEGAPSAHLRSRHEVGQILRAGCDAVELRAAIIIGTGSTSYEILRQLVERLPVMITPRWVSTRCQPIAQADVVRYLVGALGLPAGAYDVGGPEVLTYRQMMEAYARSTGRRRLIIPVPLLTPRLSSHWIGLITDQAPAVAKSLAESLSIEVVVQDHRIERLLPGDLNTFEASVREAVAAAAAARHSSKEAPRRPGDSDANVGSQSPLG